MRIKQTQHKYPHSINTLGGFLRIAAVSWSGGKDSYLALHSAYERGLKILYTIHMHSENTPTYHGPLGIIMAQQISLSTIGLVVRTTWEDYERDFKETLARLKRSGVEAAVFGDIHFHRGWVDRVCREVGVEAIEPLWGSDSLENAKRIVRMGVKALIVKALDKEPLSRYVGRVLDEKIIEDLVREGIDPSGEHGEYHTIVLDAPLFKHRIEVMGGKTEIVDEKMTCGKTETVNRYRIFIPTSYKVIDKHRAPEKPP